MPRLSVVCISAGFCLLSRIQPTRPHPQVMGWLQNKLTQVLLGVLFKSGIRLDSGNVFSDLVGKCVVEQLIQGPISGSRDLNPLSRVPEAVL